jgi:alanyl-tRNA synthetase
MDKNKWWDKMTFDDYMEIFEYQKKDIEDLYGKFDEYKSFRNIIELEYKRFRTTLQN